MAGLANALRGHSCEIDTAPDTFKNSLRFKAATCFFSALGDYFSLVVDKFNHDSSCEASARFRYQSQPEGLPVATLNLLVPD
jgi:hypothetical protein